MSFINNTRTPEQIMSLKSNSNAIVIHYNQLGSSLVPKVMMECKNADYWHKFVVENVETYERDFILKTILDFVYPADLIPVNFVKKKRAFFMARNCLDAILKLTTSLLLVPNPLNPQNPLRVIIIANHYPAQLLKFDFEKEIMSILKKRFSSVKKLLDLSEFHKDEDLKDFFPLSQPKLLLYILQFAVELQPEQLDLRDNCIKVINPIRILAGCNLITINLTNNEIACMDDLEPLKDFPSLKSISLGGNPLCNDWEHYPYINKLREMFPNIMTIDDDLAFLRPVYSVEQKNYLCSLAGADLVAQFLEHFFMVYDSENRQNLAPLYHKSSMFSVTYRIVPNQASCQNIQLNHFRCIDRNMKSFHGSRNQFLFRGQKAIMNVFASLPRSNHDPLTFHCDLVSYTELQATLVVSGIFREDKRYIGFSRCFMLLKCEENEYCITNDQLHVYNALNTQLVQCDCFPIRTEISGVPLPFYNHQYTELQEAVHKITNLNYEYSLRFLEACQYDLKRTLESFVEMHLKDEVPPEAFIQIGEAELLSKEIWKKTPYSTNLISKAISRHPSISPIKAVWQTLKDERLAVQYTIANNDSNKDVLDAVAEEIKKKIATSVLSSSSPADKHTEQSQNEVTTAILASDVTFFPFGGRKRAARRSRKNKLKQLQNQLNQGAVNQQIKVSDPSTLPKAQELEDTIPVSAQKEPSTCPNASAQNKLVIKFQQSKSGSKDTFLPLIDLTGDQTAVSKEDQILGDRVVAAGVSENWSRELYDAVQAHRPAARSETQSWQWQGCTSTGKRFWVIVQPRPGLPKTLPQKNKKGVQFQISKNKSKMGKKSLF